MSAFRPTFVSHAHADNEACDRFVAALRSHGIDIWYDRDNAQVGNFLGDEIERELKQRSAFILLLTQHSLDSFWVKLEMRSYIGLMAQDPSRLLLPVRIGPCTVPAILNALLWVDAVDVEFEEAIAKITRALAVGIPTATQPPESPSRRPASASSPQLPASPRHAPAVTSGQPAKPGDVFGMIPLESMQQMSDAYMAWYVDRVTRQLDETIAGLRAELRENDAKEASFRPTPGELTAIERLQRSGVTGMDLIDRMVEQGEDWLTMTMRRLDFFERMGQAPKDYSMWCEHALSGAYDWMDPGRGGDTGAPPRTNGPSPLQAPNVPRWMDSRRQSDGQQKGPDDNDDKRNIFRIFTN